MSDATNTETTPLVRSERYHPPLSSTSYQVAAQGPVILYFIPMSDHNSKTKIGKHAKFYFQIKCAYYHRLWSTISCVTKVICQSSIPIFIPKHVDVVIEGAHCRVLHGAGASVSVECRSEVHDLADPVALRPQENCIVMFACDMRPFGEIVEAVILDNVTVYCEGKQKIRIRNPTTMLYNVSSHRTAVKY